MSAEQIIKASTDTLSARREELVELYGTGESSVGEEFLLEEAALIEIELKNRGYRLKWQRDEEEPFA